MPSKNKLNFQSKSKKVSLLLELYENAFVSLMPAHGSEWKKSERKRNAYQKLCKSGREKWVEVEGGERWMFELVESFFNQILESWNIL